MKLNKSKKEHLHSDEELLARFKETGIIDFFHQLYERYIPLIYGLSLRYLKQAEDAQDATVDIYEDLSGKINNYEIGNFKNWLYSVVKFHCFAVLREKKREIVVDFDSQVMESDTTLNLFSEESTEQNTDAALNKCIDKLPEPQRVSIVKFFFEEKSYVEIVAETAYELKSVKSYIQNGKRNLKNCMDKSLEL